MSEQVVLPGAAFPPAEHSTRTVRRRRILLSVMACSPQIGSEPGVGWHWLLHLAREHDVVVLTHAWFREHLEPALAAHGLHHVHVHYLQAPAFGWHPHRQLNSRTYYSWWQWWARARVRRILANEPFDLIHHLTWGTMRLPCFLGGLGVPLVMGPLGGGDAAPMRLYAGIPWRHRLLDMVRLLSLAWVRIDPLATIGPRHSVLVLCKTEQSLQMLPRDVRPRAQVMVEIGSPETPRHAVAAACRPAGAAGRPYRFLFAGRLIALKGVGIAMGAVHHLVERGWNVHLDVAGDGPLRAHLESEVKRLRLGTRIRLLGAVPRSELLEMYSRADLFLFPSLRDSSGNVVLEALSRGLPVVCLDLGGPRNFIDEHCGIVVATGRLDRMGLERAIAAHIEPVLANPERLASMSRAALEHAARQSWPAVVRRAYELIGQRLGW